MTSAERYTTRGHRMSIDYVKLRTEAEAVVASQLAAYTDPLQRRAAAEQLRDQARAELAALRPERQQLVAAAALYEYDPALPRLLGMNRLQLRRLVTGLLADGFDRREDQINPPPWPEDPQAAAKAAGISHSHHVTDRAIEIAARYETARARRDAALRHLELARTAVRTAGGRVPLDEPLERPDFDSVRAQARNEVLEEFATLVAGPEGRLRSAVDALDQAEDEAAALQIERDEALCSVAFYTTARAVHLSAGLSRTGVLVVLRRALGLGPHSNLPPRSHQPAAARAAGVRYLTDAPQTLPRVSAAYAEVDARRTATLEVRDAAVLTLHAEPYRWSRDRLAEAIDREPNAVKSIVTRSKA